jgi:hypothetical protein
VTRSMTRARVAELLLGLAATAGALAPAGCSKNPADANQNAAVEAHADAGSARNATATETPANGAASGPPAASSEWHGSYESVPGTLYIAPQLKGVKWVVPETNAGLGAGTITLEVDRGTGRIRGAVDGPLGPATVDGYADGPTLSATVARKDPTDRGFTGTLAARQDDAGVSGTLNVALAEVSAVRTAAFHLTPQAVPAAAGSLAR